MNKETLSQACKAVTGCSEVVKILQCYDKLVENMTLWSQGCSELVKLLHGCDEVVARFAQAFYKLVTRLQRLYNFATTLSFLYGYALQCSCY